MLDNGPSHSETNLLNSIDENFIMKYSPPNVTALVQSMDQNVIEKVKRMYRKNMLHRLLLAEDEQTVIELSKNLTRKDCIYMIAD